MNFHIVSIFPEFVAEYFKFGILAKAIEKGNIKVFFYDLRDYSPDRRIDGKIAGGGKGMLFKAPVLDNALSDIRKKTGECKVVYLTPQGKVFNNRIARQLANFSNLVLISGRYEGIDDRFIEKEVDIEISIGDYVLTGGELPALVVVDAVSRFVDETVKNEAVKEESFENGLLEYGHYTEPNDWKGIKIPEVLRSGNHKAIKEFRFLSSLKKTFFNRIELLWNFCFFYLKDIISGEDYKILKKSNRVLKDFLFNIEKIAKEWKYVRRNSDSK